MEDAAADAMQPTIVRVLVPSRDGAVRVAELARAAFVDATVHVVTGALEDAMVNARGAKPECGVLAVVVGKNAAMAALGAGADEAVEEHVLTPELFALAARLADERHRRRREREGFQRSLAHTAQLSALGTVVAGVAHEIGSPATSLLLHLSGLVRAAQDAQVALVDLERRALSWGEPEARRDARRAVDAIRAALGDDAGEQILRECLGGMRMIGDVVRDLRFLSNASEVPPEVVDLRHLIEQALRLTSVGGAGTTIHVERDFGDDLPSLWLPRSRLLQIVTNLVTNAAHAMRARPRPLHRLRIMIRCDDTTLMIAISDTGTGIATETLPRLFEPFFTTKGVEHGTGLGLYMSREIVRKLGGDLTIDSVPGHGTTAMIFLPLVLQTRTVPERRVTQPRQPTVLLVHEDVERLRTMRAAVMVRYEVALAASGDEALALLESGARVDAVVCARDVSAREHEPLARAVASGFPSLERGIVLLEEVGSKPGSVDEARLLEALDRRLRPGGST